MIQCLSFSSSSWVSPAFSSSEESLTLVLWALKILVWDALHHQFCGCLILAQNGVSSLNFKPHLNPPVLTSRRFIQVTTGLKQWSFEDLGGYKNLEINLPPENSIQAHMYCSRPAQDQTTQHPSMHQEGDQEVPPLAATVIITREKATK